ncbi:MAG: hypothetical protein Q8M92_05035, partial [Candidatus Subteraquimicrobiales bacterium]|nr:hypothetical protein [Candidatus Subteraquimicrobiales bacterium]
KGVAAEIKYAKQNNIPILDSVEKVVAFGKRPKIMCLIGESGSGKTTIANFIEQHFGIKTIQSHTDRWPRFPEEKGHVFHTKEGYDAFKEEDIVASTQWGDVRYCCLHSDIKDSNTYIVDERGYSLMRTMYSDKYNVCGVRIHRPIELRRESVGDERVDRDLGKFILCDEEFDYVFWNIQEFKELWPHIEDFVCAFF